MTKKSKNAEPLTASVAPAPSIEPLNDGKLWIPVKDIIVTGDNPRLEFKEDEMQDLIASVKSMGILEPLILKPKSDQGTYDLIAGERRLRAAIANGFAAVPCVLQTMEPNRTKLAMLVENVLRADLTPLEEAQAIEDVMTADPDLTQADIVRETGKSQAWVSERRQLATLPDDIKAYVASGQLHLKPALVAARWSSIEPLQQKVSARLFEAVKKGALNVDGMHLLIDAAVQDYRNRIWDRQDLITAYRVGIELTDQPLARVGPHFNREDCAKCPKCYRLTYNNSEKVLEICLDAACLRRKFLEAEENEKAHRIAELVAKGIDPEKANPNQLLIDGTYEFEYICEATAKNIGCPNDCENYKNGGKSGSDKCLDPACFKSKQKERQAKERAETKRGWAAAIAELDALTLNGAAPMDAAFKRSIFQRISKSYEFKETPQKALKIYDGVPTDEQLDEALVRLLVLQMAGSYNGYPKSGAMQKAIDVIHGKNDPKASGTKVAEPEEDEEDDDSPIGFHCPATSEGVDCKEKDAQKEFGCATCPSRRVGACQPSDAKEVEDGDVCPFYCETKNLVAAASDEEAAEILLCTGCTSEAMCASKPYLIEWGEYDKTEPVEDSADDEDAEEAEN
jgi:ParB/RepB/Spo0J family partition protein